MNIIRKWTFLKHLVFSLMVTILAYISSIVSHLILTTANTIAIIDGADGPTAIYTTYTTTQNLFPLFFNDKLVLFVILLILYKPFNYVLRKIF